jgi:hypothetical protein
MARGTEPTDFNNAAERAAWVRDNPDAPITCSCGGSGCDTCDGNGTLPAWVVDPDITGYPNGR